MARSRWLSLIAAGLVLTGCEDIPLGPELGLPGDGASSGSRPGGGSAGPVLPATQLPRASADRDDDENGFQVKVFYVSPSDGAHLAADDEAAIPGSVAAWNGWFKEQTSGYEMRLDTHEGALDLTFFRSKYSSAELRQRGLKVIDAIDAEVREAGFNHPMKLHAYYFGGPVDLPGGEGSHTLGVGGSGRAMVFMRQFEPAVIARRVKGVGPLEWTMAHEIVHALGYVGECAPNRADDAHVLDDEADLMHPTSKPGIYPVLDARRDDYYGHGQAGCTDLARSVYFDPMPVHAEAPLDAPASLTVGTAAMPVAPAWRPDTFRSREAVEARVLALLNETRAAAGLPAMTVHAGLTTIARRRADQSAEGGADPSLEELGRRAGFAGSMRGGGVSLPLSGGTTDAEAIAAIEAALDAGLADSFRRLAADAEMTETGVGAWVENDTLFLSYMAGHMDFDFADVQMGEGPLNTYTLVGKARFKGARPAPEVRVSVDDNLYRAGVLSPGADWFEFVASVPRQGVHTVTLMVRQEGDRFSGPVGLFKIDGNQPLATAVISAPAPVETTD